MLVIKLILFQIKHRSIDGPNPYNVLILTKDHYKNFDMTHGNVSG